MRGDLTPEHDDVHEVQDGVQVHRGGPEVRPEPRQRQQQHCLGAVEGYRLIHGSIDGGG